MQTYHVTVCGSSWDVDASSTAVAVARAISFHERWMAGRGTGDTVRKQLNTGRAVTIIVAPLKPALASKIESDYDAWNNAQDAAHYANLDAQEA